MVPGVRTTDLGDSVGIIDNIIGNVNGRTETITVDLLAHLINASLDGPLKETFLAKSLGALEGQMLRVNASGEWEAVSAAGITKIKKLFTDASTGANNDVRYYVVGDSTRDNSYSRMVDYYYPHLLSKIGVTTFDWARSGHSALDWGTNVSDPSLDDFLQSVEGHQENTIVEFSLGLNDFSDQPDGTSDADIKVAVKADIVRCLDAFVAQSITFFLVTPVWTLTNTKRNPILMEIYRELASEYDVPLVNVHDPMRIVYDHVASPVDDTRYYHDGTHQWPAGAMRMVHVIMGAIVPAALHTTMSLDGDYQNTNEPIASSVISGSYWRSSDGLVDTNADWTSLAQVAVTAGQVLTLDNPNGNRDSGVFVDASNEFLSGADFIYDGPRDMYFLTVPSGAAGLRLNLDSDGTDSATIAASLSLARSATKGYKSISEINRGLSIPLMDETA